MNKRKLLTIMGTMKVLPVSLDFSIIPDGSLPSSFSGGTWTVSSGKAINTPTLGTELLTNGNMETDDPPSSWTADAATCTLDSIEDERTGGAGSKSIAVLRNGANFPRSYQQVGTTAGNWYSFSAWRKRIDCTSLYLYMKTSADIILGGTDSEPSTSTDWNLVNITGRAPTTSTRFTLATVASALADGVSGRFDDASAKGLTFTQLFATLKKSVSDVVVQMTIPVHQQGTQTGFILNLDSTTDPQNYVLAYSTRARLYLAKVVAGTYTAITDAAITYGAAKVFKVEKAAGVYKLYYDGTQIGADQTISDAGVINNKIHGMFSTYSGNQISAVSFVQSPF